ncbi:MAG: hypothetical protein RR049_04015 [Angelakisella sp.]
MNKDIIDRLTAAKQKKNLMALYRDDLSNVTDYTGFPVLIGKELTILARENDFRHDGYAALRLDDITFLEQIDDNGFIRNILTGEKLYDCASAPKLTDGDSWQGIFSGVQASFGGWLCVEAIIDEELCFFMGVIGGLDSNFLYLRQVDALGVKHQEETTVPLQDIVTVTFGGRYIETYRKYCK